MDALSKGAFWLDRAAAELRPHEPRHVMSGPAELAIFTADDALAAAAYLRAAVAKATGAP